MSAETLISEAKGSLESQDYSRALEFFERALAELKPEDSEYQAVRCLRATVLARLERGEEADAVFSEILREGFESENGVDGAVLASLFSLGEMYRIQGRISEAQNPLVVAAEIVARAQLKDELAFRIEYSVALILRQVGMWVESLRHAKEAFRMLPENSPYASPVLNLSAELAVYLQSYELAGELFARVVELEEAGPIRDGALVSLTDMLMVQGKFKEALAALDRLQAEAENFEALRRRGICLARLGDFNSAETALLKARELSPGAVERMELTKLLGDLLARQEHWEQAAERYQEARQWAHSKDLKAQLRYQLGKMFLKLEREEEARVHFATAAKLWERTDHPPRVQAAGALQNLASIYNRRNKPKRSANKLYMAMALLDQEPPAEVLHPEQRREAQRTTFAVLEELSLSLEMQGKLEDAVAALEPVVRVDPNLERAERINRLYQRSQNAEQAKYWSDVIRKLRGESDEPPPRIKLF
ncbi:MAG: tetratricopeptide repeat protein [Vulcanimicrobiota bacterium]